MGKVSLKVSLIAALMLNSIGVFASSLSIPHEFQFLAVNGEKVENGLFSKTTEVDLPVGKQRVSVIYNTTVRNDVGDGSTRVSSHPMIITINVLEDKAYKLSPKTKITSLKKAKIFSGYPEINIETEKGETPIFSVNRPQIEDYGVIGNAVKKEEKAIVAVSLAETKKQQGEPENTAEKMLHHWWDQADSETKKRFIKFTKNESKK